MTGRWLGDSLADMNAIVRITGPKLEIMQCNPYRLGPGQLRHILTQAQGQYSTICVWSVVDPRITSILSSLGFEPYFDVDELYGNGLHGLRWDAEWMRQNKGPI